MADHRAKLGPKSNTTLQRKYDDNIDLHECQCVVKVDAQEAFEVSPNRMGEWLLNESKRESLPVRMSVHKWSRCERAIQIHTSYLIYRW